ncbi:hypothetical protein AYO21_10018 [Fonsecaea monophora]|uniref:Clr5 domain-containing protein n=1 Tax=Fonsecaea monophora TaxID=254056 RepID=A0A177EUT0_9EURO|nr:hypothetical protein AYO21_10018 [Fonsecaea monophora]KAH0830784.1 hypothetical protein FOPE_01972 [Fonsecaea pedrosoi]OAG35784.1 hypothetical protein AYO21_10018 [Fonsecaea monophora]
MADLTPFRFKQQHPNVPSKNPSLPKKQWEELKPMISGLLHEGVTVSEILRQLDSHHVHVTRSQLTTQMNKWGLNRDNAQLHQSADRSAQTLQTTCPDSTETQGLGSNIETTTICDRGSVTDLKTSTLEQFSSLNIDSGTDHVSEAIAAHSSLGAGPGSALNAAPVLAVTRDPPCINDFIHSAVPYEPSAQLAQTHNSKSKVTTYPTLSMPFYRASSAMLWEQQLASIHPCTFPGRSIISKFGYMATILSNTRHFGEAFDILYLISSTLNDWMGENIWLSRYFLLFVIRCARSACTVQQELVAEALVEQLSDWVEKMQQHVDPGCAQYMRDLLQLGVDGSESGTSEQTAYWIASSMLSSMWLYLFPTKTGGTEFHPRAILDYLYFSPQIQATMLDALSLVRGGVREAYRHLEMLIKDNISLFDEFTSTCFVQALVYQLLEDLACTNPLYWSDNSTPGQGNKQFSELFLRQAVVILTFLVVSHSSLSSPRSVCFLESAIAELQQTLESGPGSSDYRQVIDEYLQLSSRRVAEEQQTTSTPWLAVAVAGEVAGLTSPTPKLDVLGISIKLFRQQRDFTRADPILYPQFQDAPPWEPQSLAIGDRSEVATLAKSLTPSTSSSFRLFKSIGCGSIASTSDLSMRTVSTGMSLGGVGWQFSTVTGMPSDPSIV